MLENIRRMFSSNDPDTANDQGESTDGDDGMDEDPSPISETEPLDGDQEGSNGESAPDSENGDAGTDVAELDTRLDELDEELSSTDGSLQELRRSQEEMAESVEEVNDTVRQLVGMYDQIVAAENPFVDDPQETGADAEPSIPGADVEVDPSESEAEGSNGTSPSNSADEEVVSFRDLQEPSNGEQSDQDSPVADPAATTDPEWDEADDGLPSTQSLDDGGVVLESIPDSYAGEMLVMEWLATLMERSGPAGAFRAVDYYGNVGWISPAVEERLVDVIGGPALDVFVDPTQPREPTAEEHAVSHEYLRVMAQLKEI